MSRIGKTPVLIPEKVTVDFDGLTVTVNPSKSTVTFSGISTCVFPILDMINSP